MRVWAAAACATLRGLSHRRDHGASALDLAGTVTVVAAGAGGDASKPVVGRAERAAHPASGCFGAPKSCFGTFYSIYYIVRPPHANVEDRPPYEHRSGLKNPTTLT